MPVVFKCEHGKFTISGDKAKDLYHRLDRGDAVVYRKVFRVSKTETNCVDLDFLDAQRGEQ